MNDLTLQALLQQHLDAYGQHHPIDRHRLKVCRHLLSCQTPALGGINYQCGHCDTEVPLYHSCRDRHCPQCQHRASRRWCEHQQQAILPVTYHHLVFTLPHELNAWVQLHPEIICALLFKVVWQTLKAFGADQKRLGGKLGMTAVLHTWGQNLSQHVHLHCLIPGGALSDDQQWDSAKSNCLLPVRALSRHYRGQFVSALRQMANASELKRITQVGEVDRILSQLMQKDWVVYSKPCLNRSASIIGYLARYTHRIAISNHRFIGMDQDRVRLSYTDYRDNRSKTLALHYDEFIRRFLMHVLPKGLMRIRHYGLLSNRCRKTALEKIRQILAKPVPVNDEVVLKETITYPCPVCRKGKLIPKQTLKPVWMITHPMPS
ncbi:MAG: hypothetical protein ACI9LO_001353 [Planctomycetota bacterium]|jgi:hypothetical protein